MLREFTSGERVTSIAVQDLGVGTVIYPSISHVIVHWDDGSWSKERYQDLIFIGSSMASPLPTPDSSGNKIPLRGTNDKALDNPLRLDLPAQEKFDDPSSKFRPQPYQYGTASLNPEIFESDTWYDWRGLPPRSPALLKYLNLQDNLDTAMTNWLLHNQGAKLARRV